MSRLPGRFLDSRQQQNVIKQEHVHIHCFWYFYTCTKTHSHSHINFPIFDWMLVMK